MNRNVESAWWLRAVGALLAVAALPAWAQSRGDAAAMVVYAEGSEFAVVDARGVAVRVDPEEPVGLELVEGDTVVTEHGTFLELQLVPSANMVKIAENTNFTIERRSSSRGGAFTVVYGKVRARVQSLTATESFTIRGGSALAGVRGTDFGVTVEVPRAAEDAEPAAEGPPSLAVTEVYCFRGAVEVSVEPPAAEAAERPQARTIVVNANEAVSIGPSGSTAPAMEVRTLPERVRSYWEANDFRAEPVEPLDAGGSATAAVGPRAEPAKAAAPAQPAAENGAAGKAAAQAAAAEAAAKEAEVRTALVGQMTRQRTALRTASVGLFAAGGLLCAAGILDAVLPSVEILGDNGYNFIGVGAVLVVGGVFSVVQVDKVEKALQGLRGDDRPR